tara:strand:+ start:9173 stop:9382 length:210 start_codon:yes stop_codon:yes gene_type:complete
MATYKQIQAWIKENYGFTAKTCWIAHIKAENGKTDRLAPNRIDPLERKHPCPPQKRRAVEEALRHFSII